MSRFYDFRILTKILLILGSLAIVSIVTVIFATSKMRYIDDTYGNLIDGPGQANMAISRANRDIVYVDRSIYRLLTEATAEGDSAALKEITDNNQYFDRQIASAVKGMPSEADDINQAADVYHQAVSNDCASTIAAGSATDQLSKMRAVSEMQQKCDPAIRRAVLAMSILTNKIIKLNDKASDDALAVTNATIHNSYISVLLGLTIVVTIAAYLTGVGITMPIRKIILALEELTRGNYDAPIEGAARKDEIGGIAKAALVFRDHGRETMRLRADQEAAKSAAEQERIRAMLTMADTVERETRSAVDRLSSDTATMSQHAAKMAESASSVGENSHNVATAAAQSLAGSEIVAAASEEMRASILEINNQMSRSSGLTSEAVTVSARASETISRLSSAIDQIGEVTDLIRKIADQTNLLALNATIEAARAGDGGKGFAVVAAEVKTLAIQTSRATQDISQQIEAIRVTTGDAVQAVGSIVEAIGNIESISTSVLAAVEQQSATTAEIVRNIIHSSDSVRDVTSRINEVSAEAEAAGNRARAVSTAASDMASAVADIRTVLIRVVRNASEDVNRRCQIRYPAFFPGIMTAEGQQFPGAVRNLSMGGAAFECQANLAPGTEISLSISGFSNPIPALVKAHRDGVINLQFTFEDESRSSYESEFRKLLLDGAPSERAA